MTEDDFHKMETYLLDNLSKAEEEALEQELNARPELREELKSLQELMLAVRDAGREQMTAGLETVPIGREKRNYGFIMKMAAAILVFIGVAYTINLLFFEDNTQELYVAYYEPLREFNLTYTDDQALMSTKESALGAYAGGNFKKALEILGDKQKLSGDSDVPMIRGLSHMGLEQFNPAKDEFREVLALNKGQVSEGKWYLSLCLLRTNEKDEAVKLLDNLSKSESKTYKAKAVRLLKELE